MILSPSELLQHSFATDENRTARRRISKAVTMESSAEVNNEKDVNLQAIFILQMS